MLNKVYRKYLNQKNRFTTRFIVLLTVSVILFLFRASASQDYFQLRILSYNIHGGKGNDGRIDLERIAQVINRYKPHLVSLQEVDRNTERSGRVDQSKRLGELTGMKSIFKKNIELEGGEYWNSLLSSLPIKDYHHYLLPVHNSGEQRGLLIADIEINLHNYIRFFATHLDHHRDDSERIISAEFINNHVRNEDRTPSILAGDLNDIPGSAALTELLKVWENSSGNTEYPSFPSSNPDRRLDYILFRPKEQWNVVEVNVIEENIASDHYPIGAVLTLKLVR